MEWAWGSVELRPTKASITNMAIFNQALAAQGNIPPPGDPNPAPQPAPPQLDPVAMLMDEYKRLTPDDAPAKPMFTPEQQNERIDRNNSMANVGALGSIAGDRGVRGVGGQVFKQALADRHEQRSARGIVDPLTGEETLDPEYIRARQEDKRGQILQRALAFQANRSASEDRRAASSERGDILRAIGSGHDTARVEAAAERGAGGGGRQANLQKVEDPATGKIFLMDPKTGQNMGEFKNTDGSSFQKAASPTGGDDKELSAVATGKAATKMGLTAVAQHPDAFGPVKGLPDQMGDGVIGNAARYLRDNKSLTADQLAARAAIYNQVSAIIKERAGTAQSKQELKRLQGFLPSEMDNAGAIAAKLNAFDAYLDERGAAIRNKYAGSRPMMHMGGQQPNAAPAPQGAPAPSGGGLRFNPATGQIEGGE